MIWKVKKGIARHTLYDSSSFEVARIIHKKGSYIISNVTGEPSLYLSENTPLHITISGSAGEGSADIQLGESNLLVRPPRADILILHWNDLQVILKQTEHRNFQIFSSDSQIGNITGMLKRTVNLNLQDNATPEMAALFFVLADRMLREDEIDIV